MPVLLNKVRGYKKDVNTVLIDRTTPWGNPYVMGIDGDREEVCKKHKHWLEEWLKNRKEIIIMRFSNKWVIEHLYMLRGKNLVCWCAPSRCHGDLLLVLANKEG